LLENTRSCATNPKFSEFHASIIDSLPYLEDAVSKVTQLGFSTAEKDIIDVIRMAVNNPFTQVSLKKIKSSPSFCSDSILQLVRCKEKQRDLQRQVSHTMTESSHPDSLMSIWNEFHVSHKERKIKQSLELVKRLDAGLQAAHSSLNLRIESFGDMKKNIDARLEPSDPLNINDYEPPHEQAVANLKSLDRTVQMNQRAWESELDDLKDDTQSSNVLGAVKKEVEESAKRLEESTYDLEQANEEVKRCWDALMQAQDKCVVAEKEYIAAKSQVLASSSSQMRFELEYGWLPC
jgi:exonuclease VII small subunit